MLGKIATLLLACSSAMAAPVSLQQVEAHLKEVLFELNRTRVELDILNEKVAKLQATSTQKWPPLTHLEGRVYKLEQGQTTTLTDLKTLSQKLAQLDELLSTDLSSVKSSLRSMLGLLAEEEPLYTVKSGDSLGEIALKHKVSIKQLKELNNLKKDTIIVGQKLKIPPN